MQDILVPTRDSRSWHSNLEYAARLAALLDAALTAVYNVPPPIVIPSDAPAGFAQEILEICRDEIQAAMDARVRFVQWANGLGVKSSAWHVAEGAEIPVLQSAAKWNDVIVLERSNQGSDAASVGSLGQCVLHNDPPCIIVPSDLRTPRLDAIAIGWKGTAESIRAMRAALPLLRRARQVLLIYGERGTPRAASEDSVKKAQQYLKERGVSATLERIDPEPHAAGKEILAAAVKAASDMLVMGAYGRTRFSEWIFGGATRHALQHATMALFMRH